MAVTHVREPSASHPQVIRKSSSTLPLSHRKAPGPQPNAGARAPGRCRSRTLNSTSALPRCSALFVITMSFGGPGGRQFTQKPTPYVSPTSSPHLHAAPICHSHHDPPHPSAAAGITPHSHFLLPARRSLHDTRADARFRSRPRPNHRRAACSTTDKPDSIRLLVTSSITDRLCRRRGHAPLPTTTTCLDFYRLWLGY